MTTEFDLVSNLISSSSSEPARRRLLRDFASSLGWRPSYFLTDPSFVDEAIRAHLVIEHGLESAAVLTFVNASTEIAQNKPDLLRRILAISYNNLVDWHLYIDSNVVTYCYNRSKSPVIDTRPISPFDSSALSSEAFDQIVGRQPTPNFPALDEALIRTISNWKRALSAELGYSLSNESLSSLFNIIIFIRAIEDYRKRSNTAAGTLSLLEAWRNSGSQERRLTTTLRSTLELTTGAAAPSWLFHHERLEPFDKLEHAICLNLIQDFYHNKFAPYAYDFSIMSKHALSRLYEHYSSLLSIEESPQAALFPVLPEEERNRTYGSIYTPEFIARFFARFVRDNVTPAAFRKAESD